MKPAPRPETYAAVDLGSNSFHMLVARREHGEMRVLDRIREMVRLAGGLDEEGRLEPATRQAALDCLSRFGQRLRGIPGGNLRAVGTQAFRGMKHANRFLLAAEQALGCPVDIIAGREEARLIYLGVTHWVADGHQKQLVIDIGGGSTELIIGDGSGPLEMESLPFGCVSVTNRFFADGALDRERFEKARLAVLTELQDLQTAYRRIGWKTAIGSSGTIRSAAAMCRLNGWSDEKITGAALEKLRSRALSFANLQSITIDGLSERRRPVFVGGLAVLLACFEALDVREMTESPYALREGLLYDLLGRLEHRDPRDKAVKALMSRFAVDLSQVERVRRSALDLFDQLAPGRALDKPHRALLGWAAALHEIGLALSHANYQQHSAYLVEAADLAGFSRQEQLFLAALVGFQRLALPKNHAAKLPRRLHRALRLCLLCMRLAWVFCRTREDSAIPGCRIRLDGTRARLELPGDWMTMHPLTVADLEAEVKLLHAAGLQLDIVYADHDPLT